MSDLPPWFDELYVCSGCGLDYASVSVDGAVRLVDAVVAELPGVLRGVDAEALRARPTPLEWAPIEIACHVRDVLAAFTVRLHRGLAEDAPILDPLYGDLRAARFGYRDASLDAVVEGVRANGRGFAAEVAAVPTDAWEREVSRRNGLHQEVRSLRWLVRQAAHESVHHRNEIVRASAPR
ncbi:DinB family protein [Lapillicoccus jejuensis]|uniref:DinB family protein n=1 Tax=Lapillicoccus jejuensis TaxID=402171 RepID=A0A542DYM8_9MICO|nr:DinB family protein [Lapillicoccus jejuensis]TQJ08203.1 DinB family protein [Lapillicoccus jejuensis]